MSFRGGDVDSAKKERSSSKFTSVPTIILENSDENSNADNDVNGIGNDPSSVAIGHSILIPSVVSDRLTQQFSVEIMACDSQQIRTDDTVDISGKRSTATMAKHSQVSAINCPKLSLDYYEPAGIANSKAIPASGQISSTDHKRIDARGSTQIVTLTPIPRAKQIATSSVTQFGDQSAKQSLVPRYLVQNLGPKLSVSGVKKLPVSSSKFRKILPKPQSTGPDNPQISKELQKCESNTAKNVISKPDAVIVPNNNKSIPNGVDKVGSTRYPGNKRPILRISINKEYDSKKSHLLNDGATENCSNGVTRLTDSPTKKKDSSTPEMTIENSSTNRAVTFKLDPKSGEIVVTTRPINKSTKFQTAVDSMTTRQKVDDTYTSPANLRQLYLQGQQECNALRKKLRVLRRRHKQEQDEIQMLQEHLTEIGDKIPNTCSDESPESTSAVPKQMTHSVKRESSQITIKDAKRMRHDVPRTRIHSTTKNLSEKQDSQQIANCNNKM